MKIYIELVRIKPSFDDVRVRSNSLAYAAGFVFAHCGTTATAELGIKTKFNCAKHVLHSSGVLVCVDSIC